MLAETSSTSPGPGCRSFEFFHVDQLNELSRQPTSDEICTYLDNAGLSSFGSLWVVHDPAIGGLSSPRPNQLALAPHARPIGTAGDLTPFTTLADRLTPTGRSPRT